MPGETRTLRAWPIVAGALLVLSGLVPATVAADSAPTLRARASQLSQQNSSLAVRSHCALLDLYALDSRLARERVHLVALRIQTAEVRAERAAAQHRLASARHSLSVAQIALSRRVQQLYEQGDTDPVAVILGASSVDDALSSLDSLNRIADQDRRVILQTRSARHRLEAAMHMLAAREREMRSLADQAARSTLELEQSRAQRVSYLASLAATRRLNASAVLSLERQARAVEARTRQLAAIAATRAASTRDSNVGPVPVAMRTLTVVATGYALEGRSATGAPAGWGVVAVDPNVIPLGTRMTIPGYGEGIAADTGSAVRGATIDLWFPTRPRAAAWGRRTVTIALH